MPCCGAQKDKIKEMPLRLNMNNLSKAPVEDTSYIDEITAMLRGLLRQVIKLREPEVLPILDDA